MVRASGRRLVHQVALDPPAIPRRRRPERERAPMSKAGEASRVMSTGIAWSAMRNGPASGRCCPRSDEGVMGAGGLGPTTVRVLKVSCGSCAPAHVGATCHRHIRAASRAGGACANGRMLASGCGCGERYWACSMNEACSIAGDVPRRLVCVGEKRGDCVGKTKRGKGTKWMVLVDGAGLPLGALLSSASPAEVKLAEQTLAEVKVPRRAVGRPKSKPARVVADKAYDSNALRRRLAKRGIELIVPHRRNRRDRCQDGRALRRYKRRWKVERTFAWLGNFRRLVVRYERLIGVYRAFLYLACALIVLNRLLRAVL